MPDVGDILSAILDVAEGDITTAATLTAYAPDGTSTTPTTSTTDTGKTWTAPVPLTQDGWWLLTWVVTGAGAGEEHEKVFVPKAPTSNGPPVYASQELLALALSNDKTGLQTRELLLQQALRGASRGIDAYTGRRFWLDSAVSARVFSTAGKVVQVDGGELLLLDDIGSTSGLIVEVGAGTIFNAVSDVETWPTNAIARRQAITGLFIPGRWGSRQVRVTARWGWPYVPDVVEQATLIQAARLYRRKDSPEGVLGSAEWGIIRMPRLDPDVVALVSTLVLPGIA